LINVEVVLISEIVEIVSDLGEPDCKLINPYRFYSIDDMRPWPEKITDQNEILMRSGDILTIADPTQEIIEKYFELTK
jgi:hypothetical protein